MDFFDRLEEARRAVKPSGERRRAQWQNRTGTTIPGTRFVVGQLVTVDPSIQRTILGLIGEIAPKTAKAFNDHLIPYADRALAKWPVKTGLSKSLLQLQFTQVGTTLSGEISNVAPYVIFIDRSKFVRVAIFNRSEKLAAGIAQQIGDEMARL